MNSATFPSQGRLRWEDLLYTVKGHLPHCHHHTVNPFTKGRLDQRSDFNLRPITIDCAASMRCPRWIGGGRRPCPLVGFPPRATPPIRRGAASCSPYSSITI